MDDDIVREALSHLLASTLHEAWRASRKKEDGTFEPRIKKSMDNDWNKSHGRDVVDIANTEFKDLPFNWQYENLEAAKVAINLCFDIIMNGEIIDEIKLDQISSIIHDKWLERNKWVYDSTYGNPTLIVSYNKLPKEEQDKDKSQAILAINIIQAYHHELIDIKELCQLYGIQKRVTFKKEK